jgi:DNA-binding transcriptional MerR regulator
MDHDEIIQKRVRRIATDHGCSVAEVNAALDHHPIELDRDTFLKRTIAERRATLLGLNAPIGHAVQVIQHEPGNKPTSTERIRAAIDRIRDKRHQDDLPSTDQADLPSAH